MGEPGWQHGVLVGFDLETTGLDRERDEPVSYAFATYANGRLVGLDHGHLMPGVPISPGATAVHGLTVERLEQLDAPALDEGLTHVAARLCELSALGVPIVGANLSYDLTIVDRSLLRLDAPSSLESLGWSGPALDVLVIDRALDADFEARPERRLGALCDHYAVMASMHSAVGDACASVQVLLAQVASYPELASMGFAELQAHQAAWHGAWCVAFSARRAASGGSPLAVGEAAWPYLALIPTLY